jgi:hypothetical protein
MRLPHITYPPSWGLPNRVSAQFFSAVGCNSSNSVWRIFRCSIGLELAVCSAAVSAGGALDGGAD